MPPLGDSLGWHQSQPFFTYDADSNATTPQNYACAWDCHGAWWYTSCRQSNLNGPWGGPSKEYVNVGPFGTKCPELMNWVTFTGDRESVKTTEIKIRQMPGP